MTDWSGPLQRVSDAMLCGHWHAAAEAARKVRDIAGYDCSSECMTVLTELAARLPRSEFASARRLTRWRGHDGTVSSAQLLSDDRHALTSGLDGTIRRWDLDTMDCVKVLLGHQAPVVTARASDDGSSVISLDGRGMVMQWDVAQGRPVAVHRTPAWLLDVTPNASVMLWGGPIGITVVQVSSGRHLRTLHSSCGVLAISPDGRRATSATTDGIIQLWSVATGAHHNSSGVPHGQLRALAFAGDRGLLLAGGDDATLRTHHPETLEVVHEMTGHRAPITAVSTAADGKLAVSGAGDIHVNLWDLRSGTCVRGLDGEAGWGSTLAVSKLGHRLLTGSLDGELQLWQLDWHVEPPASDWDEGARPCLEQFLTMEPKPLLDWNESYFDGIMAELRYRGYGWIARNRVIQALHDIARARRR